MCVCATPLSKFWVAGTLRRDRHSGRRRNLPCDHTAAALSAPGSSSVRFSSTICQLPVSYGGNGHDIHESSKQMASGAVYSIVWSTRNSDHDWVTGKAVCSGTRGGAGRCGARRGSVGTSGGRGAIHIGTSGRGEGGI